MTPLKITDGEVWVQPEPPLTNEEAIAIMAALDGGDTLDIAIFARLERIAYPQMWVRGLDGQVPKVEVA